MNKIVWVLILPFLLPFIVLGFVFGWASVGVLIGLQFTKEFVTWLGVD